MMELEVVKWMFAGFDAFEWLRNCIADCNSLLVLEDLKSTESATHGANFGVAWGA